MIITEIVKPAITITVPHIFIDDVRGHMFSPVQYLYIYSLIVDRSQIYRSPRSVRGEDIVTQLDSAIIKSQLNI